MGRFFLVNLAGRICVITGASRGLGAASAELLASHGAAVALCSKSGVGLDRVADELRARHGAEVVAAAVDVADADAVTRFAERVDRDLGPVYALLNNAAVLGPVGPVADVDCRQWTDAVAVNVAGVLHATKAFVASMARHGGGAVVNLSGGGLGGPGVAPRISAYTTSKAAVVALTESLARELVDIGVRVNAIAPGPQDTRFTDGVLEAGPEAAGVALYEATRRERARPAPFAAFAALLLYVLSDEAAWLTGRLLSARWDTPESVAARQADIVRSSLLQLRRIDGDLYVERPRDDG